MRLRPVTMPSYGESCVVIDERHEAHRRRRLSFIGVGVTIPACWLRHLARCPEYANKPVIGHKKAPLIERGFCIQASTGNQAFQAFQVLIRPLVEQSWLVTAASVLSSGRILLASCLPSSTPH